LTPERLEEIIDAFEAGKGDSIKPGPQIDRFNSAPAGGFTSLTDESAILKFRSPARNTSPRQRGAGAASVPPSRAGKPQTEAVETAAAIESPSPVKVRRRNERATSAESPEHDNGRADRVAEEVEQTSRGRRHSEKPRTEAPALRSPELAKAKPAGRQLGPESPEREAAGTESANDRNRPQGIARPEKPDDLKMISGIGPKVEGILN